MQRSISSDVPTAKTDGQGQPIHPDARYFVQDTRSGAIVGNYATWWCSGGAGYTCDLNDAGIFLGCRVLGMRETDVPWLESYVRVYVVCHVRADTGVLDRTKYRSGVRTELSSETAQEDSVLDSATLCAECYKPWSEHWGFNCDEPYAGRKFRLPLRILKILKSGTSVQYPWNRNVAP